jgi:(1->4)-alpha-D-glucan 1-alpha-D-glucosylmutase
VAGAKTTCLSSDAWLIDVIAKWLSGELIAPEADAAQAVALTRFQQLTGPLCAKAVEDTAFYRYGRLISRNDVGFDARRFSISATEFHDRMRDRARTLPRAMLATATHDHKRGEDVRARLAVLSELAPEWMTVVERWIRLSLPHCRKAAGNPLPSKGDLAILFQTVVGAWPVGLIPSDADGCAAFAKRVEAWQQKALREAKLHTDWTAPNEDYERSAAHIVSWLFSGASEVLPEIAQFANRISRNGAINSLSQLVAKLTAPGVPDIYQGTEFWDLSLVDPDNRSPVDFAARQSALHSGAEIAWTDLTDRRIKQFVLAQILAVRKDHPELFARGAYRPLQVDGSLAGHIVAFARILGDVSTITIFCRLTSHLAASNGDFTTSASDWITTKLIVPAELQYKFSSVLAPGQPTALASAASTGHLLRDRPVAFLVRC